VQVPLELCSDGHSELMINGGTTPNVQDRALTHFLENDRVAVRVFYAEELTRMVPPSDAQHSNLARELLIGKLYIGAPM